MLTKEKVVKIVEEAKSIYAEILFSCIENKEGEFSLSLTDYLPPHTEESFIISIKIFEKEHSSHENTVVMTINKERFIEESLYSLEDVYLLTKGVTISKTRDILQFTFAKSEDLPFIVESDVSVEKQIEFLVGAALSSFFFNKKQKERTFQALCDRMPTYLTFIEPNTDKLIKEVHLKYYNGISLYLYEQDIYSMHGGLYEKMNCYSDECASILMSISDDKTTVSFGTNGFSYETLRYLYKKCKGLCVEVDFTYSYTQATAPEYVFYFVFDGCTVDSMHQAVNCLLDGLNFEANIAKREEIATKKYIYAWDVADELVLMEKENWDVFHYVLTDTELSMAIPADVQKWFIENTGCKKQNGTLSKTRNISFTESYLANHKEIHFSDELQCYLNSNDINNR